LRVELESPDFFKPPATDERPLRTPVNRRAIDQAESLTAPAEGILWIRIFLMGGIFIYPLHWLADFFLYALPQFVQALLPGHYLASIDVHFFSVSAESRAIQQAPQAFPIGWTHVMAANASTLLTLFIVAALFVWSKAHRHLLAGLALAVLAHAALLSRILEAYYLQSLSAPIAGIALIYFAAMCAGLRWSVEASTAKGFWSRLAVPVLLFALPQAVLWSVIGQIFHFRPYERLAWDLPPIFLASLVVSVWPVRPSWKHSFSISRRYLAVGTGLTLLFSAGIFAASRASTHSNELANREILDALPPVPVAAPYPKSFFQKGVNFTSEYPDLYDSQAARDIIRQLPSYGVNSVALVPFGFDDHTVSRVRPWSTSWGNDDGIRQLARLAHSLGLKVFLKPHLWRAAGDPSQLDLSAPGFRAKWFDDYQKFLEHYALLATEIHADVFCVGVEFETMSVYDADWRRMIARAREIYPGPLTYAAGSGPEFENITFWDALDYIGINEYYSLPADLSTDEIVRRITSVQKKFSRPVLFTEAGFPSLVHPNRQPWDRSQRALDLAAQARCYEALYRGVYDQPWFSGIYWWSVPSNGIGGRNDGSHTPWQKPAMNVMKSWFTGPDHQ
jgi:hypothetical protein